MISQSKLVPISSSSAELLYVVIATSTIKNLTAELIRQFDGSYFVKHMNCCSLFCVPSVLEACAMGRAPASCFILFRSKIQGCLVDLNLRLERKLVSKHAANLWKGVTGNDHRLADMFKKTFDSALYRFNAKEFKIRMMVPPAPPQQPAAQEKSIPLIDDFDSSLDGLVNDLFPSISVEQL
ncbi:3965_t:CDS:1 [Cetraspora pellucida]|uniref:3965_t:CDS:1 n=1 Tax=Cetraspora pellucida TaxID=1433469 RepID=A0A9N9CSA3_9GLOM|nr:3965_t:CDS:1 [Cetraspora pellucida]